MERSTIFRKYGVQEVSVLCLMRSLNIIGTRISSLIQNAKFFIIYSLFDCFCLFIRQYACGEVQTWENPPYARES